MVTPAQAATKIISATPAVITEVNKFTASVFHTRGGRIGSGMGSVIEALWGFFLNKKLAEEPGIDYQMGWIYGHEYNDFSCVKSDEDWDPETRVGELLRVEVKSMVASADESKAHFDRLQSELETEDMLAVFVWDWTPLAANSKDNYPKILDHYVGLALPIAKLRDDLHVARGGSFVSQGYCPDDCNSRTCTHVGEPLNKSGVRERRTGPEKSKRGKVSYAANFGGMLRMLGSRGFEGKKILSDHYNSDDDVKRFLDFMGRQFSRVKKALT